MQLALERGNTDLVILTTLILFAVSFNRYLTGRSLPWLYSACITAALSILFKLWAGPGMLIILSLESLKTLRRPNFGKRFRVLALVTVFLAHYFWQHTLVLDTFSGTRKPGKAMSASGSMPPTTTPR